MTPQPEIDLLSVRNGSVVAPAGYGKTHQIVATLSSYTGDRPVLVLTHTNAGVAELRARLHRDRVSAKRFRLQTIDGWARRMVKSFPLRSGIRPAALELNDPDSDYDDIRAAAVCLLASGAIADALAASYAHVIVDEYQDCTQRQHAMMRHVSTVVPVCALGDPLQAIFGFGTDPQADWESEVITTFPVAHELQTPWRWKNAGATELADWLAMTRVRLQAGDGIDLRTAPEAAVTIVRLKGDDSDRARRHVAASTPPPNPGGTVFVLGDADKPPAQHQVARSVPGATVVEAVELHGLIAFADKVGRPGADVMSLTLKFAADMLTQTNIAELKKRLASIARGSARKPATNAEAALLTLKGDPTPRRIATALLALREQPNARVFRPAMFYGCLDAIRLHDEVGDIAFGEAARRVRDRRRAEMRITASRPVGSTLLLKGLQADAVVILNPSCMDARHLYVAMTRGVRQLVICTPSLVLSPS